MSVHKIKTKLLNHLNTNTHICYGQDQKRKDMSSVLAGTWPSVANMQLISTTPANQRVLKELAEIFSELNKRGERLSVEISWFTSILQSYGTLQDFNIPIYHPNEIVWIIDFLKNNIQDIPHKHFVLKLYTIDSDDACVFKSYVYPKNVWRDI